ncbi:MAG: glycosyltransferase, partial [Lachnospiraceae bacterium]|nr:glycosyltransferase [Lachnospiraceae bacterium]
LQGLTNVETLSRTENVEMLAEYYSMADVFVLPSLAENYATVSLESMACGTPVVGFNAGGIPEQLTEGKGIVVPVADGEAFTKAIREAVNGEVPLLRGEDLAGAIREENSVEHMVAEYKKIYEELLNKE